MKRNQENPSSSTIKDRLLLKKGKLPMKSNPFGEEEDMARSPNLNPNGTTEKGHFCSECKKGFSSGRALRGHMSRDHVQANIRYDQNKPLMINCNNNDQLIRKVVSDQRRSPIICSICNKDFPSQKSLFGHIRCHFEKVSRGMEPPLESDTEDNMSNSCDQDKRGDDDDDENDDKKLYLASPMVQVVDISADLKPWPVKAKRGGRGIRFVAPVVAEEENNQEEAYPVKEAALKLKRKSIDYRSKKLQKIIDYANTHFSEDTESDSELLMNRKKNVSKYYSRRIKPDNNKRKKVDAIIEDDEDKKRYKCNNCDKSFATYHGLGGHSKSHNKFKLTIQNAVNDIGVSSSSKDQQAAPEKRFEFINPVLSGNNNQVSSPSTAEDPQEAVAKGSTLLAIDLNQLPKDMESQGDGMD